MHCVRDLALSLLPQEQSLSLHYAKTTAPVQIIQTTPHTQPCLHQKQSWSGSTNHTLAEDYQRVFLVIDICIAGDFSFLLRKSHILVKIPSKIIICRTGNSVNPTAMNTLNIETFMENMTYYVNEAQLGKIFVYPTDTIYGI